MDNQDLLKRAKQCESDRTTVQSIWDAIERFVTPYRGRFFEDNRTEGSIDWFKSRDVYDSTAVDAHQNLSASIHGALTSPSIRWFVMRFRSEKLNKDKKAIAWLQGAADRVYHELQDSNFNLEINESYQDLCGPGTAFLTLEEDKGPANAWNGLNFTAVPLKEGFFEQDHRGLALRFYRKLEWTPGEIISKFGEQVPDTIRAMDERGLTEKQTIYFCVYPRRPGSVDIGKKVSPSKRPWEYRYILEKGAHTLGKPGGYYEMPVFIPRWRKTSGSVWGNSPAMMALGDILTLNQARMMQLRASEKLIDPPIFAEERSLITDLNLKAASLSVVRRIEGVKAFETRGQISVSDHMIDQLQGAVRRYFFADQLTFPDPQAQPMTAMEVQVRYELMQRLLGPTLGRIQNDLLNPIVSRAFRMLAREGQLDQPPQIVIDEDAEFDIEYLGALARSQRMDSATASERWISIGASLAEVYPAATDVVDADDVMRNIGRDLGIAATSIRDETEVEKVRNEREARQKQMADAMAQEQAGKGAKAQAEAQAAQQEVAQ